MIYLLRGAGPQITWYCKEAQEISFMLLCWYLKLFKGRYYGQNKIPLAHRGSLHVTCRNSYIQPETEGSHAKRGQRGQEARALNLSQLQEWISTKPGMKEAQSMYGTLCSERFEEIGLLRSFILM